MRRQSRNKKVLSIALATTMIGMHARANNTIRKLNFENIEMHASAKKVRPLFPKHEVKNKLAEIILKNQGEENFPDARIRQIVERSYTPEFSWTNQIEILGREFGFEKEKIIQINIIHKQLPEYNIEKIEEMLNEFVDPTICHGLNKLAIGARKVFLKLKKEIKQRNKMERERRKKNPTRPPKRRPNDPYDILMVKK